MAIFPLTSKSGRLAVVEGIKRRYHSLAVPPNIGVQPMHSKIWDLLAETHPIATHKCSSTYMHQLQDGHFWRLKINYVTFDH